MQIQSLSLFTHSLLTAHWCILSFVCPLSYFNFFKQWHQTLHIFLIRYVSMFDSWQSKRAVHILFDRKQNGQNASLCSTAHFVFTRFFGRTQAYTYYSVREVCSKAECMYKRFYNLARSGFFFTQKVPFNMHSAWSYILQFADVI